VRHRHPDLLHRRFVDGRCSWHALHRAGVAPGEVYLDRASGSRASHPQLDTVLRTLRTLRDGDMLVTTRLDRLGRSVLHLVQLGTDLRERGVGLRVLEQGIDTATAEGRAMFGMLSVLAEFAVMWTCPPARAHGAGLSR